MSGNGFYPFVNGKVRCPGCHRERPMEDLLGTYDPATDSFVVLGMRCSHRDCNFKHPESIAGLIQWGIQIPKIPSIPITLEKPACPFCGRIVVKVPDGPNREREFEWVRCPDSPLLYKMKVE